MNTSFTGKKSIGKSFPDETQDPDYPARELHFHTPQTRGWQCARFSKFPQELVLRLDHPARIHQIQLLSHEYKIATKIELFTGLLPPGETSLDRAIMRRLGHLSFDPNTASGHQARELKSVHVNVDAAILRVVVHKCHVNKLNIYNQVGIVALNVIGEPIAPMDNGLGGGGYDGLAPGPRPPRHAGVADMSLDLDVDPVTASKIREIHAQKENAVSREDYDEAKRLRDGINRLKAVGAKVAQLEHRKRSAIEAEDYDAAKVIKSEIDKLREAGGVVALGESVGAGSGGGGGAREDIFNRALTSANQEVLNQEVLKVTHPQSPSAMSNVSGRAGVVEEYQPVTRQPAPSESEYGAFPATAQSTPARDGHIQNARDRRDPREYEQAVGQGLSPSQLAKIRDTAGPDDVPPVGSDFQAHKNDWAYDDRPAVSKAAAAESAFSGTPTRFRDDGVPGGGAFDPSSVGGNNDEVAARATGAPRVPSGMDEEFPGGDGGGAARRGDGDGGSRFGPGDVPEGFNADLPPPEPISSSLTAEASPVVEAFGEYAAACLYSKNWMHREAALHKMESDIARGGVKTDKEVFRAVCQSLGRLFKDKVANVFASSCRLLATATRAMGPGVGAREVHSNTANLVPQLLEKLGDAHAKARDAAREALMELAESELALVAGPLVRPVRSQSAWRIVLGRLSIMLDLVPRFGLAKAGDHGLTLEAVMEFTARAFESPNGEVRSTAVKLTLECCAIAGRAVEKFLPKNLKPAIRDVIDEGLGIKTGGAGDGVHQRGGGYGQASAARPSEPRGRAAPGTPPGARGGGGGYGGGYAAGGNPNPSGSRPLPNPSPGAPPSARELKAEIAERELALGKNHPDVAVALTDLAALYSEEEAFGEARPLYERALRIQEKTLGAEHQDTTQTLTDLAICHLDQGNNDVGRPLLERALVLQEQTLGPEHADVAAIRDVLQSLDADDA